MTQYTKADIEAYRKKREEDARERREAAEKARAKRAWISGGGNEAEFEQEWPALRRERIKRRAEDAEQQARAKWEDYHRATM